MVNITENPVNFFGLVFLLCLFGSAPSWATSCFPMAVTPKAMSDCANRDWLNADKELDEVYRQLIAKITPEGQERLQIAKAAWINYRLSQCAFDVFGSETGSINSITVPECYAGYALQQRKNLLRQLNCEEGDASCGNQ